MNLFLALFFFHSLIPLLIVAELSGPAGAMASLQGSFIALLLSSPLALSLVSKNRSAKKLFFGVSSWIAASLFIFFWWSLKIPFAIGLGMPLIGFILWLFLKGVRNETGR